MSARRAPVRRKWPQSEVHRKMSVVSVVLNTDEGSSQQIHLRNVQCAHLCSVFQPVSLAAMICLKWMVGHILSHFVNLLDAALRRAPDRVAEIRCLFSSSNHYHHHHPRLRHWSLSCCSWRRRANGLCAGEHPDREGRWWCALRFRCRTERPPRALGFVNKC
ncbi:hypothetical protein HPB51_010517 [Rhipicephalus microplus]|uniref:Uncharacterized protein n=1 Tax=Rhipicephalus microplus TaxID=6941 RepID=A0A9J6D9N3_RHIMP|nr:hypothetical protein HPB51_010517 [Rhipicephalus microplus]